MLVTLCQSFDANQNKSPAFTRVTLPLMDTSSVPSFRMMNSSCLCWCGGCEDLPGLSVLMWLSKRPKVAEGASTTSRRAPLSLVCTANLFQSHTAEPSFFAGALADSAAGAREASARAPTKQDEARRKACMGIRGAMA